MIEVFGERLESIRDIINNSINTAEESINNNVSSSREEIKNNITGSTEEISNSISENAKEINTVGRSSIIITNILKLIEILFPEVLILSLMCFCVS